MKENLEILHKVLVKLKLSESVPYVMQKRMLSSKKRILVKILKAKGNYNVVLGATLSIFFTAKQIGLGLTVAQSAIALAAASLIVASSVVAGSYTAIKRIIIPQQKTSATNITKDDIITYDHDNKKLNLAIDPNRTTVKQIRNKQKQTFAIAPKKSLTVSARTVLPKTTIPSGTKGLQNPAPGNKYQTPNLNKRPDIKKQTVITKNNINKKNTTRTFNSSHHIKNEQTQKKDKHNEIPKNDFIVRNKNNTNTKNRNEKASPGINYSITSKNSRTQHKEKDLNKVNKTTKDNKKKKSKENGWMFHIGSYGAYHQPIGLLSKYTDYAYGYGFLLGIENCIFDHFLFGIKAEYFKFNFNEKLLSYDPNIKTTALTFLLSMSYRFKLYHNFFIAPFLDGGPLGAWVIEPGIQVGYILGKSLSIHIGLGTTTIIDKGNYLTLVSLRFGVGFSF